MELYKVVSRGDQSRIRAHRGPAPTFEPPDPPVQGRSSGRRSYASGVDAYLAMASKRDQREYAERPVPEDAVRRILDAGRIAGSAANRQPWRFLVLGDRGLVDQVAQAVYAPPNLLGAPLVIAMVVGVRGPVAFDAGRAAQT